MAKSFVATFRLPDAQAMAAVREGSLVLICAQAQRSGPIEGERLWVRVVSINKMYLVGQMVNTPLLVKIKKGDLIRFVPENIYEVSP